MLDLRTSSLELKMWKKILHAMLGKLTMTTGELFEVIEEGPPPFFILREL